MQTRAGQTHAAPLPQVIKVGTSSLVRPDASSLNLSSLARICETVRDLRAEGHRVVLVSSGAVGVGAQRLGLPARPADLAQRQALAAVGQVRPHIKGHQRYLVHQSPIPNSWSAEYTCIDSCMPAWKALSTFSGLLQLAGLAARCTGHSGVALLICMCVRQVYLMRYYEDFFSALGLVRPKCCMAAWPCLQKVQQHGMQVSVHRSSGASQGA